MRHFTTKGHAVKYELLISKDLLDLYKAQDEAKEIVPCTNYPDLFFPVNEDGASHYKAARDFCASCPIVAQCAEYGIKNEPDFGIWGGLSVKERDQIRAYRNKQKVA
jgi:WhiB family redox-sensing transcriptional regulator